MIFNCIFCLNRCIVFCGTLQSESACENVELTIYLTYSTNDTCHLNAQHHRWQKENYRKIFWFS